MRVDHPQLNKRDRRAEPSFWVEEPTDDALSLLENALRGGRRVRPREGHSRAVKRRRLSVPQPKMKVLRVGLAYLAADGLLA